jgi:predicted RNA binding protein YcfA (HicA-like mRNA interferase family)
LERAGFVVSPTSGSHCRLVHVSNPVRKVTIPVHSGDLKRGTLRAIVAQAGLTVAEFLALL